MNKYMDGLWIVENAEQVNRLVDNWELGREWGSTSFTYPREYPSYAYLHQGKPVYMSITTLHNMLHNLESVAQGKV